ncbi:MAG: nucleotide exchange factor GrpE [Terracidiphilus sp.]
MTEPSIAVLWQGIRENTVQLMREVDAHKRGEAAASEQAQKQQAQLLLDVLELLDSFERVFANIEPRLEAADQQAKIWVGNFRTVRKVLERLLAKHEVRRIESPDGMAMPGLHTIVETRVQPGLEEGTIVEEMQRGYLWKGQVLRKAMVAAVKN